MEQLAPPDNTTLDKPRSRLLGVLDRLEGAWLDKALDRDSVAAQLLLEIEKQRAALLGLTGASGTSLRIAAGAVSGKGNGETAPTEVKVVIEYVQDWREARRQRGEG
jgi:hypothetical protein